MPRLQEFVQSRQEIVARDDGNGPLAESRALEDRARLGRAGGWLHAAGVSDDLQIGLALERGAKPLQHVEKVGGEAGLWIALLLEREDRHRQLGEVFERQVIELALLGEQHGRIEIIAPKSTAVADAHAPGFHRCRCRESL